MSQCWEPSFDFEFKFQFSEIKLAGEGAWELVAYADGGCTKELGVISPEDMGQCKVFEDQVRGVITRPKFNGDPR